MWVRCFGVPAHAWDFFSSLVESFGSYVSADDNFEKKKAMDVARILVRMDSLEAVNKVLKVKINDVVFSIRVEEDWCGPMQWSSRVNKKETDSSSDDEDSEVGIPWPELSSEEELGEEEAFSDKELAAKKGVLRGMDSCSHVSDSILPPGSAQRDSMRDGGMGLKGVEAVNSSNVNASLFAPGVVQALGCVS